ncbi:MAG: DUF4252 domain-containing protein [Alistipes sp.]|nr:DUF4252 domain-containing protein [Alistipes sp.]
MKRSILLVLMMLPIMAMAQLPQFAKLNEKYEGKEGVTAMTINKQMISMFVGSNADFKFVDEVQILLSEDADVAAGVVKDAKKAVKKSKLEELISANDEGAIYTIYTKTVNDIIKNLVIIVENDSPSGFIVISGDITQDKISEVIKIANM